MEGSFRPHILMDKLAKLNSSQQSIETLSHWCIFHMHKAKQVVETWEKQFHCAPRDQRLAFLYLANDIIQNSRRKGADFVAEFWRVLPDSLRDVIANGDEFSRKSALRLVSIWEERKVFGSRGQILKEEFIKRKVENGNRHPNHSGFKLQPHAGNVLDKLVSGYQSVYGRELDEDAIFNKCRTAISAIEKADKDAKLDYELEGNANSSVTDELKGQQATLRDCIGQLLVIESSRSNLVSHLREALEEQEHQLGQVRDHRQAAQKQSEHVDNICLKLLRRNGSTPVLAEQSGTLNPDPQMPPSFMPGAGEQSTSMIYTQQAPLTENSDQIEDPKSAAAAVAAKLAASTSSAQMLTLVLSSLASGVIGNSIKESSSEYHWEKRAKIDNEHPSYIPRNSEAPECLQHTLPVTSQELNHGEAPPPPSSPPPSAPLPPSMQQPYTVPQYVPTAMPILYNLSQQAPICHPSYAPPFPGTSEAPTPLDGYQHYPTEAGSYGLPSSLPLAHTHGQ